MTGRAAVLAVEGTVPRGEVVVGLGGGADSALCAWACVEAGRRVVGAFVDHGLAAGPRLRRAALEVARRLDVEAVVLAAEVRDGPGVELRAREARREALSRIAAGRPVVLGHTRDDRIETFLMHLFRGAGTRGLIAMSRVDPPIHRPLLELDRAEVRALATDLGLPFVDDPMNDDRRFTRSRVRHELVPLLEEIFPALRGAVTSAADRMRTIDGLLDAAADDVPVSVDGDAVLLPVPALLGCAPAVADYAVWRTLLGVLGPQGGTAADVAAVMDVARGRHRRRELRRGVVAVREGPHVAIYREPREVPASRPMPVPGRVRFGATVVTVDRSDRPGRGILLDPSVASPGLVVRAPRPGDRIEFDGGRKRVVAALAERAIPARLRPAWPLLVVGGKIAAIPGVRVAPWARPRGEEALAVTIERTP